MFIKRTYLAKLLLILAVVMFSASTALAEADIAEANEEVSEAAEANEEVPEAAETAETPVDFPFIPEETPPVNPQQEPEQEVDDPADDSPQLDDGWAQPPEYNDTGYVAPAATGYVVDDGGHAMPAVSYSRDDVLLFLHDEAAPDFSLQTTQRSYARLSDYSGRTVLLVFWTSLTQTNMDRLEQLRSVSWRYPEVQILTVNELPDDENNRTEWTSQAISDHAEWINDYFAERGMNFPVLLDINGDVWNMPAFRSASLPMMFFIDRDGIIRIPWPDPLPDDIADTLMTMMRALDG